MHSSAMAIIPKNNPKGKNFNRILKIHNSLHHKNIINIEHYFQDSENFYLLTEICHNGCLDDLIERRKKLSESEVKYYILQIIDLLKYLKKNNVIHRDLKLSHLLISDKMEIKISDFFCSIQFNLNENKITSGKNGALDYMAPEMVEDDDYSYEVDVWSAGIIMYYLLIGKKPFTTFYLDDLDYNFDEILEKEVSFPEDIIISEQAQDLIKKLLNKNPKERIKLEEILEHDFFKKDKIPKILPLYSLFKPPLNYEYICKYKNNDNYEEKKIFDNNNDEKNKNKDIEELSIKNVDLNNKLTQLKISLNEKEKDNKKLISKEKELEKMLNEEKETNNNNKKIIQELNEKLNKKLKNVEKLSNFEKIIITNLRI